MIKKGLIGRKSIFVWTKKLKPLFEKVSGPFFRSLAIGGEPKICAAAGVIGELGIHKRENFCVNRIGAVVW